MKKSILFALLVLFAMVGSGPGRDLILPLLTLKSFKSSETCVVLGG
ncbi:MAG: hypothetical protein MZV63_54285 [Marinilabiliales bacterium]|nr:hypothetical protein [Marinilabiliales bacterium]